MGVPPRATRFAVVAAVVSAVVAYGWSESAVVDNVAYLGAMVGAAVGACLGAARAAPGRTTVPRLVAGGVVLTALGDVLWEALAAVGADNDVSIADVPWFLSYVMLSAALWIVLRRHRLGGRWDADFLIDAATVVSVSVTAFWFLSIEAIVSDDSVTPAVRLVWAAYPVADAVLLALVLRVLVSPGARDELGSGFAWGTGLWLAADIMYLSTPGSATAVWLMDSCWLVAPALLAGSAWRAGQARPVGVDPGSDRHWRPQLLIAVGPLFVPPALEVVNDLRGRPDQPAALFLSSVVLIALAFVRTSRMIRSEERAHRELERARDRAEAHSRTKTLFVANVSHEIRTPLTTVLATAEMLEDTPLDPTQRRLLEKMQRAGRRLNVLVEEVLDFSRIEAGEVTLERVPVDLPALVADLADGGGWRAGGAVGFEWVLDPCTPRTMWTDPTRLFQIVSNLLDNAFKFTLEGQVRLEVRPSRAEAGWVDVVVSDTGIGIPQADLDRIFESFQQVDASPTRSFGGSGLGLAICQELSRLLGGRISVTSREGAGSTFVVSLPVGTVGADGAVGRSGEARTPVGRTREVRAGR